MPKKCVTSVNKSNYIGGKSNKRQHKNLIIFYKIRDSGESDDPMPNRNSHPDPIAYQRKDDQKGPDGHIDGQQQTLQRIVFDPENGDSVLIGILKPSRDRSGRRYPFVLARRIEAALRESHEKYRALVEVTIEGIVMVLDGRCAYLNHAMLEMLGYHEDEALLLDLHDLFSQDTGPAGSGALPPDPPGTGASRGGSRFD